MNTGVLRSTSLALVAAVMVVAAIVPARSGGTAPGRDAEGAARAMGAELLSVGFSDSDLGLGRSVAQFQGRRTGSVLAVATVHDPGALLLAMSAVLVVLFAAHPRRNELCVRPAPRGPPLT
ncbi:MAG TPA: hypothetical protein VHL54_08530 [Actinomycetota bacterium]|nr:hypothetical protein [Actinomycetota bacterium]